MLGRGCSGVNYALKWPNLVDEVGVVVVGGNGIWDIKSCVLHCFQWIFVQRYSQKYLAKDYVEGKANELKPNLNLSLNRPKKFTQKNNHLSGVDLSLFLSTSF